MGPALFLRPAVDGARGLRLGLGIHFVQAAFFVAPRPYKPNGVEVCRVVCMPVSVAREGAHYQLLAYCEGQMDHEGTEAQKEKLIRQNKPVVADHALLLDCLSACDGH